MSILLITLIVTVVWTGYLTVRYEGWWPAWIAGILVIAVSSALGFTGGAALGRQAPAPPEKPPPGEWEPAPLSEGEIADRFDLAADAPYAHVVTVSGQTLKHPCLLEEAEWTPGRVGADLQGSCLYRGRSWAMSRNWAAADELPGEVVEGLTCTYASSGFGSDCLYVILDSRETWRIKKPILEEYTLWLSIEWFARFGLAGWLAGSGLFAPPAGAEA